MTRPRLARRPVAAGLFLLAAISLLLAALRGRLRRVEVAGDSMRPALQPGDFVVLRVGPPRHERAAGMVVALETPPGPSSGSRPTLLLKRIVGLPGEMVRVGEAVEVNGRVLDERYRLGAAPAETYRGAQAIAPGHYFVLGDNRAESTDSRAFGEIPASAIVGVAIWRYWPLSRLGPIRRAERVWT